MQVTEFSDYRIRWLRAAIIRWGRQHYASFPWRDTRNRWHALVAEIMLQRTRAEQVLPAYLSFTDKYPCPEDYAHDPEAQAFATLGLHWREEILRKLACELAGREIPDGRDELLALPGIGDYIAAAFRSLHLGLHDVIIDSNVVRIYGRFFGFETNGETRRKPWLRELAERITPRRAFRAYNYGLIDFTREVCRPVADHSACPIRHGCDFFLSRKSDTSRI